MLTKYILTAYLGGCYTDTGPLNCSAKISSLASFSQQLREATCDEEEEAGQVICSQVSDPLLSELARRQPDQSWIA